MNKLVTFGIVLGTAFAISFNVEMTAENDDVVRALVAFFAIGCAIAVVWAYAVGEDAGKRDENERWKEVTSSSADRSTLQS